ncbi:hypothetical protein Tco_1244567 [Tanacetum coccineum]
MVQKPVLNNVKNGTGQREVRPVWTNAMKVNHQKFSNSRRNFAPTAVLTKSGLVSFSTARQSFSRTTAPVSAARGYTLESGEDSLKLIELMDLCTKLIDKVTILENALKQSKESHAQTLTMLMKGGWKKLKMHEWSMTNFKEAKDSEVCKITRADGSSSFHGDIQALLRRLDRQDLSQLYSLVQERFKDHPLEGHDLDLWGDLGMLFDPNEEDDIWLNQQYWELLRWKLHEYNGVYSLFLDGTSIQINMLVEKKYPLKKEILVKMINLKIEAEEESTMAHELIKFIKSQIAEQSYGGGKHYGGRGGGVGSNSRVGEGKEEFMGGIGGGSFAKRSMVAKDGLRGDGFVVDGGRSPSTSSKDREDGGVENKSSMGSRLIVTGEIVVEWLLEKLVGLPMCSPMVERMVDREEKRFLD